MKASKLLIGLFAVSMLAFTACSSNKDNGAPVRSGYNGTTNGGRGSGTFGNYSLQMATVSNLNVQAVMAFLAAGTTGTSQVGTISAVQVAGSIGLGCNTQGQPVIANGSNGIMLNIIDNYVQQDGPIEIFMPVTQGQVYGGSMNLTFQDSLGYLQVQGTYTPNNSAGTVQGTISFRNNNGASGTIGSFVMPISSFLQCQAGY
jgi:hypothetical protein